MVRPLCPYHGQVGAGLPVEMQVKSGPVTLLSEVEREAAGLNPLELRGAHAESVFGPILEIGNTDCR